MTLRIGFCHHALVWVACLSVAGGLFSENAQDVRKSRPTHDFLGLNSEGAKQQQSDIGVRMKKELQSLSSRLKESRKKVAIGWVLITFSIALLWFSERRIAKMESLILTGESTCKTVSGKFADEENRGRLVHIANETLQSLEKVTDSQFNVTFESDCVRLRSEVHVFQYIQHEKKIKKEKIGGGKEMVTEYYYSKEWRGQFYDGLRNPEFKNTRPHGLKLGSMTRNCDLVAYGDGFELTDELIKQCNCFQDAADRIGDTVAHRNGHIFTNGGDSYFYFRNDQQNWRGYGTPIIGDVRVKFEYVPEGPASIIALQAEGSACGSKRDSFLPFRLIPHGLCGFTTEKEKELLKQQGKKRPENLVAEDSMGGCLSCICKPVTMCFSVGKMPEIYHLWEKDMNAATCFQDIKANSRLTSWSARFVGWALMFVGLYATFSPISNFITAIPLLGVYLAVFADWLIWVFCFMVTLMVATAIIGLAYFKYRPSTALFYLLTAGSIVLITIATFNIVNR